MKVYNVDKTQVLTEYDLTKGYLKEDIVVVGKRDKDNMVEYVTNPDNSTTKVEYITDDITEGCYVYVPYTDKELQENEMQALKTWFNEYYTIQEQKLRRLHTLGKLTDEEQDPYQALLNLYNLAEINRARIQELEALIG